MLGNKPLVRSESGCFPYDTTDLDHVALGNTEMSDRAGMEALLDVVVKAFPRVAGRVRLTALNYTCCIEEGLTKSPQFSADRVRIPRYLRFY